MSNRLNDESATDTYEVFISYSHKDRLIAESLDTALEKWRVFLDQPRQEAGFEEEEPEDWGLLAGSSWKKQVASSLEDEPVVIVLMSQNSQSSAAVAHEIGAAVEAGLPIIAVSVDAATQIADQDMDAPGPEGTRAPRGGPHGVRSWVAQRHCLSERPADSSAAPTPRLGRSGHPPARRGHHARGALDLAGPTHEDAGTANNRQHGE